MKKIVAAMVAASLMVALVASTALAAPSTVKIGALQPTWSLRVFSAYVGPLNGYEYASPGLTALHSGREAGLIKAGLVAVPGNINTWDQGLFAFKPAVSINTFAASPLTYDVVNQYGTNPVWMTIEIDTGTAGDRTDNITFQMVPAAYAPSNNYFTVDAGTATNWLQWADASGTTTGSQMTLSDIATQYTDLTVVRTYLRLGMGDSYAPDANGTQAWVDKASIGGVTYDFVLKGTGYAQKDWTTNPGYHGLKTP
jgi:hypothetical protein